MSTKLTVSFPDDFLSELDAYAKEQHRSRNDLLQEAVREYISNHEKNCPAKDPSVQAAMHDLENLRKVAPNNGTDSTDIIRNFRDAN